FVYAGRALGIYVESSPRATVRRNIILGTTDTTFHRSPGTTGAGIALNNETQYYIGYCGKLPHSVQSDNAKIYGNLVAFTSQGIAVWGGLPASSFTNTFIYNNTLVDNTTQFLSTNGRPMPGSQFINNVLLSLSSGTTDLDVRREIKG